MTKLDHSRITDCIAAIKTLRIDILMAKYTEADNLPPRAEINYLAALAHMELAACEMQLCDYHRMQAQ